MRLVCFPHAGGAASAYHRWGEWVSREIEVWAIELPGHGSRFREPAEHDLERLARAIQRELSGAGLADLPFAFFGHSMGGLLAFEVARAFRDSLMLTHLFPSGCNAPNWDYDNPPIHALPTDEFLDVMVKRYEGIPEEVLREKDLLELVLPALRADMKMIESHRRRTAPPFPCPITVLAGSDDSRTPPESIKAWQSHTTGAFESVHFRGGHFFLQRRGPEVVAAVESRLLDRSRAEASAHRITRAMPYRKTSQAEATVVFKDIRERRDGEYQDSLKWNRYKGRDVLPLWVADMDCVAPAAVIEALQRRVAHGVFGYGVPTPSLIHAVQQHLASEYGWDIQEEWLVWLPGLDSALSIACGAVGQPGDSVVTASPIYKPFITAPQETRRSAVHVPLLLREGRWEWDFERLETLFRENPRVRLLLLCHPHNPVGRVWREEELRHLGMLAGRYGVVVCSDEVHCGLVLDPGLRHHPFATLSVDAARRSITLMSASKSFNLPALGAAFAVIPDAELKRAFCAAMPALMPHASLLGFTATEAAFTHGKRWRAALIEVLRGNRDHLQASIARLPGLRMTHVEATYLAWIDAAELCVARGIVSPQRFFDAAGVGLSAGEDFDAPGGSKRFVRLNFGCARATLDEALRRMADAVGHTREQCNGTANTPRP